MPLDPKVILLLIPVGLLQLGLQAFGLVDLSKRERRTKGPKWLWTLIILFGSLLGAAIYFALGRDTGRAAEE